MPGLAHRNEQFSSSSLGFWSRKTDEVGHNQLQKFWGELSPLARQELVRIDKQTLFEQARKNLYCSRCNGLLLEGFLQIITYGKSLQQDGTAGNLPFNRVGVRKNESDGMLAITNGCCDESQDPSVHPWGGLTTTRDGLLTLMDYYLFSKSLKGVQNVFDSGRARERERELLYPDACGGGGRGWISQGMVSYGRGHGTRESCALHTARLSCDTLVDFWSALGEETRQSLLRMKEDDFIERLMYRFDSKRFCRDCRRNVIREFKELKELKRLRREPRCTTWFCGADTTFQYEVTSDSVQVDWHQTFAENVGTYHHFEWAIGTGEGKSDILEFENVGLNGGVQVNGLDLNGLTACYITLRAFKTDGRCSELSVKAHALNGQQCVHCRLVVGDGFVSITRGENIRLFFEHAEETEEEEDDDSMDKDGSELDGECSRPQKHAKSPELAREFLLDAATVIFKEQVEKAFREGTARQNAHSIFVCLALKQLEERVHVACKEIITLERQTKLLEEEEKEKRDEEKKKERRRTKEREKKLRRKERLKGKDKEKEITPLADDVSVLQRFSNKELSPNIDLELSNDTSSKDMDDTVPSMPDSCASHAEHLVSGHDSASRTENLSYDSPDCEAVDLNDESGTFMTEQSKNSNRKLKFQKDFQSDPSLKWSDRRQFTIVSENASLVNRSELRNFNDSLELSSRIFSGSNRQLRTSTPKSNGRNGVKYNEKFQCSNNRNVDRYDFHSCSCNQHSEYRAKVDSHVSATRLTREAKPITKLDSAFDIAKNVYRGNRYNQTEYLRESCGRPKVKIISGNNPSGRDLLHAKKIWEPMESQKKCTRSNSDSDVTVRPCTFQVEGGEPGNKVRSHSDVSSTGGEIDHGNQSLNKSCNMNIPTEDRGSKLPMKVKGPSYPAAGAADDEDGFCNTTNHSSNGTVDPIMSSNACSDNCSSCLSEGDSNTASSNHGNVESSSTSDSEETSQQSEGRESSVCIQNGYPDLHDKGLEDTMGRQGLGERDMSGLPLVGSKVSGMPLSKPPLNHDDGIPNVSMGYQHQGIYPPPPIPSQNVQFPVFPAPTAMGYYHQNPVSWPAASASGLMPFPHPNHYMYPGSLGYGLNGNSGLCMPYGTLQSLATPMYPGPIPVYHPVSKANGLNTEEQSWVGKPEEGYNEPGVEKGVIAKQCPLGSGEGEGNDNLMQFEMEDNTSFSLFHFGGPVAFSKGKSNPVASRDGISKEFSSQFLTDGVENKKENIIEEYNLFASSNGLRFSFF